MTRRLTVVWPDREPFAARDGAPIRLLAVSDAPDPALDHAVNREAIGRVDAIVGCGDLEPGYLGFLGDAFGAGRVRAWQPRPWRSLVGIVGRRAAAPRERPTGRARWHHRRAVRMAGDRPRTRPGATRSRAWLDVARASAGSGHPRVRGDALPCWS